MKLSNFALVKAIEDTKHFARYNNAEMADAMDISNATFYRYLGDPSTMPFATVLRLQRLATKYGVKIYEE